MIDKRSPLSILTFLPGTINADFQDCIKYPGIYGTILSPIKLMDQLIINNGKNEESVRFAGQFAITQDKLSSMINIGMLVGLSERLELYWK